MKYTENTRQLLNKCILDISIAGLIGEQAVKYVKDKTGVSLSPIQIGRRKWKLRQHRISQLSKLQQDRYEYKIWIIEQLQEKKYLKDLVHQDLLKYCDDPIHFFKKQKCVSQIDELGNSITELMLLLKAVDSGYGLNTSQQMEVYPEGRTGESTEKRDPQAKF